jgi:hypothetical protein
LNVRQISFVRERRYRILSIHITWLHPVSSTPRNDIHLKWFFNSLGRTQKQMYFPAFHHIDSVNKFKQVPEKSMFGGSAPSAWK